MIRRLRITVLQRYIDMRGDRDGKISNENAPCARHVTYIANSSCDFAPPLSFHPFLSSFFQQLARIRLRPRFLTESSLATWIQSCKATTLEKEKYTSERRGRMQNYRKQSPLARCAIYAKKTLHVHTAWKMTNKSRLFSDCFV